MIRRGGPIVQKSIAFAIAIAKYCEKLNSEKKFVIANQLLKSATSIGANVFEAQFAERKLDFIHKLKIAEKEANETLYWLILCQRMENYQLEQKIMDELTEVQAILFKIIVTSKKNLE